MAQLKALATLLKDSIPKGSIPSTQLSETPVQGDMTVSSDLQGHYVHMVPDMHRDKAPVHKK